MKTYESGATRDGAAGKPDYRGYLAPEVIRRFGEYMLKHQVQADGQTRASNNWQKGMPLDDYMSSMLRHLVDVWSAHEAGQVNEEALCALMFNVNGYLFETIMGEKPAGGPSRYRETTVKPKPLPAPPVSQEIPAGHCDLCRGPCGYGDPFISPR